MCIVNNKERKMSKKAISGEVQMFGMSEDAIREQ